MPAVVLKTRDAYKKAFRIVAQVGGPFQGRGEDMLIVSDEQYQALVKAGMVSRDDQEEPRRGTKAKTKANV
jgi:hypothetical protein